jgi:hypothetical protein
MAAALRAALSEHRRARAQRAQLRRLKAGVDGSGDRVLSLPFLFETDLGLEEWEQLSRELERRL